MTVESDAVSIRKLNKSYLEGGHERKVLNDINADFESGLMHAIVGPSGSGKSTLLNLIAGIDLPDDGTITVAGRKITELSEKQRTLLRRRHIGIVFQFFNLVNSLSVAENVMLPLELNNISDQSKRTNEALDRVGLQSRGASFPSVLSGGEQQRVAIARAVAHQPSVILADEPTGNLDEHAANQAFTTLAQARGQSTVIIVTHSTELAKRCNRQWQLRAGQLSLC